MDKQDGHWHLDKRVPIAIIITLIGQAALGLIIGTLMWAQIQDNSSDISDMKMLTPYIYSMVENTKNMAEDIRDLKITIDKLATELKEERKTHGK